MKNVTIAIDDETHRRARIRAAELGTSLSALVKVYLTKLADEPLEKAKGVRDMQTSFTAEPGSFDTASVPNPDNAPYFVNGKWVFTKDGKSRKPGALRHLGGGWTKDFDEWPDGFIDAMYGDDTPASNTWWISANDVLKKPEGK
jgi:hypothetical protein